MKRSILSTALVMLIVLWAAKESPGYDLVTFLGGEDKSPVQQDELVPPTEIVVGQHGQFMQPRGYLWTGYNATYEYDVYGYRRMARACRPVPCRVETSRCNLLPNPLRKCDACEDCDCDCQHGSDDIDKQETESTDETAAGVTPPIPPNVIEDSVTTEPSVISTPIETAPVVESTPVREPAPTVKVAPNTLDEPPMPEIDLTPILSEPPVEKNVIPENPLPRNEIPKSSRRSTQNRTLRALGEYIKA